MNLSTPRTNAFSKPENPNIITERIQNSLTNPKLQNLANLSYIIAHSLYKKSRNIKSTMEQQRVSYCLRSWPILQPKMLFQSILLLVTGSCLLSALNVVSDIVTQFSEMAIWKDINESTTVTKFVENNESVRGKNQCYRDL